MVEIEYVAPESIDEAVKLFAGSAKKARLMAGGTDLIIQLKNKISEPHLVIDLKKITDLKKTELTDDELIIGPAQCCAEFTARDDIKAVFPGLVEAAFLIGSTQVQGRASVGGNLCNASPAADSIPALIVTGAQCVISGQDGTREVAVEDFVTGVGTHCLRKGEILTSIRIKRPQKGTADAYLRMIPRTEMDIAVAGAGVSLTIDKSGQCTAARVAIGAVAPTAILVPAAATALIGSKLEETALEAAADAARKAASPITDRRGTKEYRTHVVGVLVKRAAKIAAERAKGN